MQRSGPPGTTDHPIGNVSAQADDDTTQLGQDGAVTAVRVVEELWRRTAAQGGLRREAGDGRGDEHQRGSVGRGETGAHLALCCHVRPALEHTRAYTSTAGCTRADKGRAVGVGASREGDSGHVRGWDDVAPRTHHKAGRRQLRHQLTHKAGHLQGEGRRGEGRGRAAL